MSFRKTNVFIWVSVLLIGTAVYFGWSAYLSSSVLDESPVCFAQSDLDGTNAEKSILEQSIIELEKQKRDKQKEIDENNSALSIASGKVTQIESEILNDDALAEEKKKVGVIAEQRDALHNVEKLTTTALEMEKTVASNKILAATAEKNIAPAETAYNVLLTQYSDKSLLDTLQKELSSSPNPSVAQINARRSLERASVVMDPKNQIPVNQLTDRQNLETIAADRDAAKKQIPAKSHTNYVSAFSKFNVLVASYNTTLQKYKSTYAARSVYRNTLTYAQLLGKVNTYNAQVKKYEDMLKTYNTTYSNNASTAPELTQQVNAYKVTSMSLRTKIAIYNRKYSKTSTKTLEILAQEKEKLEWNLITTKAWHTAALNVATQSQTDYDTSITLSNAAKTAYNTQYAQSKLTVKELETLYKTAQEKYEKIVQENDIKKVSLSTLKLEEKKLEILGKQIESKKSEMEGIVIEKNQQFKKLNTEITLLKENLCATKFSCKTETINTDGKETHVVFLEDTNWNRLDSTQTTLGQISPDKQVFNLRYNSTQVVYIMNLYMRGIEFICPEIVIQTDTFAWAGTCVEALNEVEPADKEGITCGSDDIFVITRDAPIQASNKLFSNFLRSDILYDQTCGNGATNYPACDDNQTCGNGIVDSGEDCDGWDNCDEDCKSRCTEESAYGLSSSFFGWMRWLKSETLSEKCPKKCPDGQIGAPPDCKCPDGQKLEYWKCVPKIGLWKKILRSLRPDIQPFGNEKYFGVSWGWTW